MVSYLTEPGKGFAWFGTLPPMAATKPKTPRKPTTAKSPVKETAGSTAAKPGAKGSIALPPASEIEPSSLIGARAPELDLEGPDGKRFGLADFAGRKLVLYFYPKDDTPGCTLEANDFQAAQAAFARKNAVVVGVSRDSATSHAKFCKKHGLAFTLLSDPEARVLRAYGVWAEKVLYGNRSVGIVRTTFVLDEKGVVLRAFSKVKVSGHVDAVLASLP
jgi:peroxiredoxin Q/BCP